MARIAAVPLLMVLIWLDRPLANYVALAVFVVACLTDYWDGDLARVRKEVTQLGKLLDPIADKMLITASLVMLVQRGSADAVPTILILLREFAVSGLRQVAASEGVALFSSMASSTIWSTSSPMSSPISLPIFFIHFAILFGSFSSRPPHFDGSAKLSILLSSERITLTFERTRDIFLLLHLLHWGCPCSRRCPS